ncbi:catalase [Evansella sp. LMS18]|uniref:catalase n=1 Tax=Evansella sp. LMS18 TaxID=2924033 RepID=UPI0020D0FC4E|nr:catalase [Evansella sp. LMS18]UTR12256.1 catalase [Evansella sp. LMS18]
MSDKEKEQKLSKDEQLEYFRKDHDGKKMTTNHGVRVSEDEHSLKAGVRGPTLMEDFHFREKMTHFDHERIPERVVHARGYGVHGHFQVYEPLTDLTKAKFLQDPSVKTPVFVRFSTVAGQRGSSDTVRDTRGFATKFYTEEGNYDLVANNMPVFFIQDAMKFPDVVHAVKPEPHNEIPQATAAHDTFWDFVVNNTESAHMIMWLLSDRAIPRSYRMMEGFGVHTFRLVNEEGKGRFVKFHWKPVLGVHSLLWDEAHMLWGRDADYHRKDLYEAIESGHYPEFELGIQVIEEEDEFKFDFDVLDPTKIWPEEDVPVRLVGKMTLNKNPDNFFAETEQVAFHPGHVVPGIDFTNDPLLQGRLFSYTDTQLTRLGGPNFQEIPINRPVCPFHNNQRDGFNRMSIDKGQVAYHKNSLAGNSPETASEEEEGGYVHYEEKVEGKKVRARSESFKDHYSQATLFWNSMSEVEKKHLVSAFHFEIGKVKSKEIQQAVVDVFNNVSGDLAKQIAEGVAAEPPAEPGGTGVTKSSPALSQMNTSKHVKTRKVAILARDGFDSKELKQVKEALEEKEVIAQIINDSLGMVRSVDGEEMEVDTTFLTTASVIFDAVYIAGGKDSVEGFKNKKDAIDFINEAFKHCKTIGAANDALEFLIETDIKETAKEESGGKISNVNGVVTVNEAENLEEFTVEFLQALAEHRHWSRQMEG